MISRTALNDQRSKLQNLEDALLVAKEEIKEKQRNVSDLLSKIKCLQENIQNTSESELVVSEHAIVRYFERVLGFDINQIVNDIKANELVASADHAGIKNTKIKTKHGYTVIIKNRTIVTIST